MGKRIVIEKPYCPRCRASHPPGDHMARPKKIVCAPPKAAPAYTGPAVITDVTHTDTAMFAPADGVALKSSSHPRSRKKAPKDVSAASVETMEAPAAVAAELDRLGAKGIAKRKAANKKRKKAEKRELDDAELARKRALRAARQARYRAKLKKPKKKRKAKT